MIGQNLIDEFAAISQARSFASGLMAIGAGIFGLLSASLYQLIQLPWYSALLLAYMFQFSLIIWAFDRFLVQDHIIAFVQKHTKERLGLLVRERRMHAIKSDLSKHYSRDNRLGVLLDILEFLLSPSDMIWFKVFKNIALVCSGVILLPYAFVANAPERCLVVLTEGDRNGVNGYQSYWFSLLFIGFVLFGISAAAWLSLWWFYCEGLLEAMW